MLDMQEYAKQALGLNTPIKTKYRCQVCCAELNHHEILTRATYPFCPFCGSYDLLDLQQAKQEAEELQEWLKNGGVDNV